MNVAEALVILLTRVLAKFVNCVVKRTNRFWDIPATSVFLTEHARLVECGDIPQNGAGLAQFANKVPIQQNSVKQRLCAICAENLDIPPKDAISAKFADIGWENPTTNADTTVDGMNI